MADAGKCDRPVSSVGKMPTPSKVVQACELIGVFVPAIAVLALGRSLFAQDPGAQQMAASLAILLMIFLIWVGLRLRGQSWSRFGLGLGFGNRRTILRAVGQSIIVAAAASAAFVGVGVVIGIIAGQANQAEMNADYLRGNPFALVVTLLIIYTTASFGEEVIYRAFLINRIEELGSGGRRGRYIAVAISSVAFGLAHYSWGVAGMVQTAFMGLALGVSYLLAGRNLWVTILAHGYMDTILVIQMYLTANQLVTD